MHIISYFKCIHIGCTPYVYSSPDICAGNKAQRWSLPVSSLSSVSFIDSLPADKHALHDIRFRFKVDNIWSVITTNHPELKPNDFSKDIILDPIETHDLPLRQLYIIPIQLVSLLRVL